MGLILPQCSVETLRFGSGEGCGLPIWNFLHCLCFFLWAIIVFRCKITTLHPPASLATHQPRCSSRRNRLTLARLHMADFAKLLLRRSCCRYRPWDIHRRVTFHGALPGEPHSPVVMRKAWPSSCRLRLKWIRWNYHPMVSHGGCWTSRSCSAAEQQNRTIGLDTSMST
jgi:hypothetical protein